MRPCIPAPKMATVAASGWASQRAVMVVEAPVFSPVTQPASMRQTGWPVSAWKRRTREEVVGRP